ncbi:hypothetical protein IAR55_000636 [Kwoniella newhampshirensis]|uniref:VPS4-associated protein 1 n=1 Tax=Kwoniella newhampshirensis TaxID=1651941 RepID=A0AAW0Z758_9TREE
MTSPPSTVFANVYYERKTATARPCYICNRPTQTVLATIKTEDFLYTCDNHLLDPASPIAPPPTVASSPTPDEIRKVVEDYKAREARKSKDQDKEKESDQDRKDEKEGQTKSSSAGGGSTNPTPVGATSPTPAAAHRNFTLHRSIFEMRKNEIKRKEMGAKAREVGKGLPQVPRTGF